MAHCFRKNMLATLCSALFLFPWLSEESLANNNDPNNIMQAKIESFGDQTVLNDFTLGKGSELKISSLRAISGKTSLEWDWQAGSNIIFHRDYYVPSDQEAQAVWGRRSTPLFSFFIYNETPIDDYLVVDFGSKLTPYNNGAAGLKVKLNFKGWRAIGVSLNNDIDYRDELVNEDDGFVRVKSLGNRFDSVKFTAPKSVKQGRFFIDHIMLSVDDARYQWSDYHIKTRITEPEIKFQFSRLPKANQAVLQRDMQTVEQRFTDLLLNAPDPRFTENIDIDYINNTFKSFEVKKNAEGIISGRHVLTVKQKDRYQIRYLSEQDKALFDQYIDLNDYSALMYNISRAYHKTTDLAKRKHLANMYVLLTEHLIDQGFVKGSGLITTHHWGYSSRWWYLSAFLMRDVLEQAQLKQTVADALLWYAREFKASFDMIVTPDSSNLDYYNTLARQQLALLLLEDDPQQKLNFVNSYAKYVDKAIAQIPPGTKDGLRPDGTTWRHNGHYPGYGFPALPNMALLANLFKGTAFAFNDQTYDLLKKVLISAWVYTNPDIGMAISGRLPFVSEDISGVVDAYYWLAFANNYVQVDTELAAIYLAISGKSAQQSEQIFKQKIEPAKLPQGFWSFNGGAFGIHRYNDKMVTLKTYNSNVWSSEIYVEENRYGRYQSNGSAQILSHKKAKEQGYLENGWDWNRMPGVTSIHLPWEQLNSPITHTLMLRGETPYNGTSALQNKYGMMASYLLSPTHLKNFDPRFTAKKTVLAADDHLIMVGTDIRSSHNNKDVETTLFQLSSLNTKDAIFNGKKVITGKPQAFTTGDWIIDGSGNGYLITDVKKGFVVKQNQHSIQGTPDKRYAGMERKATEGVFSSAWIDHSEQGNDASYEYVVFLDAKPEQMQQLANQVKNGQKPYQFSVQGNVHIVQDNLSNVKGYVFYSSESIQDDLVNSSNYPSIVMAKQNGAHLVISGVTPDLNIAGEKHPKPIDVKVSIKGQWEAIKPNEKVKVKNSGNNTELIFSSYFGIPQEVELRKK
ncbi:chondroitin-sulfate-ABC endolyase/exolyase [Volucribacter psittacicida]|uniref:Chondroitin sulfate ABC lyase n=1 Tax=Volucribacter psittacicida TaxID=203482 RepID=A0A4R1FTL2_9PAST|nr:chondroitinase family polysaccharide lyase [Volucribacter psittacicida]TCJ95858.1 chondroitin-sulfate-ABC endolyase/exolyase [Volucribacter psittacicida]